MPAQFTAGVSHRFNDHWSVSADYQRVFLASVFKDINITFVQSATGANLNLSLPQNYRDINVFGVGAEYRYNSSLALRAGFHYAQEAIPNDTMLALVPAIPTTTLTGGLSYAFSKDSKIDLAVAFALQKTLTNSSQPNTSVPLKVTHSQINMVAAWQKRF